MKKQREWSTGTASTKFIIFLAFLHFFRQTEVMKMKPLLQLIPVTFIAGGLFLGCGGESHDHHDHDHDGDGKQDHGPGEHGTSTKGDDYPLKTCLVSDEDLESMGGAFVHKHEGVTVKFCCEGCVEDFQKDPKKFLAKLEAAKKGELPKPTTEGPDEGEQPEEPSETSEETENDEKPAPTSQDSSE